MDNGETIIDGARRIEIVIAADPPARLDKALARDAPADAGLSRSRIARLIAQGAVRRGGAVLAAATAAVAEGDRIVLELPEPAAARPVPETIPLAVVFEDAHLIVVDKPAGMVVHPAPGAGSGTLVHALLAHCGDSLSGIGDARRPGIVHRLDKDTSGLIVAAKHDRAHHGLAAQFAAHTVERRYTALVHGVPDAGDPRLAGLPGAAFEAGGVLRVAAPLGRHPHDRQRQAVRPEGGRHAVTRARVGARYGHPPEAALLECWLETGRTHQIRVHMAHVGHPLLGDPVYGGRRRLPARAFGAAAMATAAAFPRQALHAAHLGFHHPVTESWMVFQSPLPQDMAELLAQLAGAAAEPAAPPSAGA